MTSSWLWGRGICNHQGDLRRSRNRTIFGPKHKSDLTRLYSCLILYSNPTSVNQHTTPDDAMYASVNGAIFGWVIDICMFGTNLYPNADFGTNCIWERHLYIGSHVVQATMCCPAFINVDLLTNVVPSHQRAMDIDNFYRIFNSYCQRQRINRGHSPFLTCRKLVVYICICVMSSVEHKDNP